MKKEKNTPEKEEQAPCCCQEGCDGACADEKQPQPDGQEQELAKARVQADEYLQLAQRMKADFENYKRRANSLRQEALSDGRAEVLLAFLPVLDNLERAVVSAAESQVDALRQGVEMVLRQFADVLSGFKVTAIAGEGQPFDPSCQYAVMQDHKPGAAPGSVTQVMQKGYRMDERVLREAMVMVQAEDETANQACPDDGQTQV
nr:nucleotide exchange factor GrpE [bacterium]